MRHGPSTATELAERLKLTPAAIRRHTGVLVEVGHIAPRPQKVEGQRGRGRPASVFILTDSGRAEFSHTYDKLAIAALAQLHQIAGDDAIAEVARRNVEDVVDLFNQLVDDYPSRSAALVAALNAKGYMAVLRQLPDGEQLCQYHCPIMHVAAKFPKICEVESQVYAELVGSDIQRIAYIALGDETCDIHIPRHEEEDEAAE
jgi:predicted ArsR family transcriptional regulator